MSEWDSCGVDNDCELGAWSRELVISSFCVPSSSAVKLVGDGDPSQLQRNFLEVEVKRCLRCMLVFFGVRSTYSCSEKLTQTHQETVTMVVVKSTTGRSPLSVVYSFF